jgi:hypothetical protein
MITVGPERPEDIPWVRKINLTAFEQPAEAEIVDRLCWSFGDFFVSRFEFLFSIAIFTATLYDPANRLTGPEKNRPISEETMTCLCTDPTMP